MKKVKVKLKGITPVLMHAFPLVKIKNMEKKPIEEQAELVAYREPKTKMLYIPAINIHRALIAGATYSKGKGRASLQKQTTHIQLSPERISFGTKDYEIDSRPIVVPATKGRVMRHRPRLDNWEIEFYIEYDENLLTEQQLRQIMDDTCSLVGLLDFRPEKKGPFGRAMVTSWESADK